jgi:hypothetical protein
VVLGPIPINTATLLGAESLDTFVGTVIEAIGSAKARQICR